MSIGQTITTMGMDNGLWTQTMNLHTKLLNTQQKKEGKREREREGGENVLNLYSKLVSL